jgi:hypothetical protein
MYGRRRSRGDGGRLTRRVHRGMSLAFRGLLAGFPRRLPTARRRL